MRTLHSFSLSTFLLLFLATTLPPGSFSARAARAHEPMHFTSEERAWLAEHPVLRLGVGVAFPPFQYVEEEDGDPVFKGMVADYLQLLEGRLGARMEPVFGITFKEALERGRRGEIDVFPCIAQTPERRKFLAYTKPYLIYPLVIITRHDTPFVGGIPGLDGKRFAVVKTLATYSKLVNDYPDVHLDFHFENTIADVIDAVSLGRADACIVNLAVASHIIQSHGLTNLKMAAPAPWEKNKLAMAVPRDRAILADILQKALDAIPQADKDRIADKWISLKVEPLLKPEKIARLGLTALAVFLAILSGVLLWNRRLGKEIDQKNKAQAALQESEHRYRQLFETMLDGFALHEIICDGEGEPVDYRFLEVNPAFERLTGLKGAGIVGRRVLEVMPQIEPLWIERYGQVALTGEADSFEEYSQELDKYYEVVAYRPAPMQFAVIFSDVTERRKALDLMIQTEKMMSLGGLAAGMAHEINNPLGGILQSAQNIRRRFSPDIEANDRAAREYGCSIESMRRYIQARKIDRMLDSISEAGDRAAKIVSGMLAFSREARDEHVAVDVHELIEEALGLAGIDYNLTSKYDFRHITIEREFAPDGLQAKCSRGQIAQVLLNILLNAAQALSGMQPPPEAPLLRIATRKDNGFAVIEIEDNGPGMDAEQRRHVFEPFFTTKEPGQGTGLGLSVSYFIVTRNHKGTLEVQSAPGIGTTFIIRLPRP